MGSALISPQAPGKNRASHHHVVGAVICLLLMLSGGADTAHAEKAWHWATCKYWGRYPYTDGSYERAIACADKWVASTDKYRDYFYDLIGHPWLNGGPIWIWACRENSLIITATRECVPVVYSLAVPDETPPPQVCAGNPVAIATGTKIQHEQDIAPADKGGVSVTRYYTSGGTGNGVWQFDYQRSLHILHATQLQSPNPAQRLGVPHVSETYGSKESACARGWANIQPNLGSWAQGASAKLNGDICQIIKNGRVVRNLPLVTGRKPAEGPALVRVVRADGTILSYRKNGAQWTSLGSDTGRLQQITNGAAAWRYTKEGIVEDYAANGRLLSITDVSGTTQTLTYDPATGLLSRVQDSTGGMLQFGYEAGRLTRIAAGEDAYHYTYNEAGMLTRVDKPDGTHRQYHYENSRFPRALTGITDERNVRYATWTYDDQGRAVASEHAGGADRVQLAFNADGSTTVTNPLGKQTTYHFTYVAGARRVTRVEGRATTSCQGAHKAYTYTDEGWLASQTDWKGHQTTFTYNARGQETARTEAAGTPAERAITTEWHPTLNVKTRIVEPGREILYTYDANGNITRQTTRPLATQ